MTKETRKEIEEAFGLVPDWIERMPDSVSDHFWGVMRDNMLAEDPVIPHKYQQLIGLALAGATRCRYCTLFHTEAAKLFGATDEEIHAANALAGFTMMGSTFINGEQIDYDRFAKETEATIRHVKKQMAAQTAAQSS